MLRPFGWQAVAAVWQFAPVVTGAVVVAAGLFTPARLLDVRASGRPEGCMAPVPANPRPGGFA